MIQIGQVVIFDPFAYMLFYGSQACKRNVAGVVTAIHKAHRWFLVEYGRGKNKLRIGFKFDDIGHAVQVIEKKG